MLYSDGISFFVTKECQKKSPKMMKIVNIDEENRHIFRTITGILMTFSRKMWLAIILKVTKNRASLSLSLSRKYIFVKTTRRVKLTSLQSFMG